MLDVNALVPTANDHYFPRNFVPVPPFLISAIDKTLEDYRGDATKILLSVIETITDFDNRIEDEDENIEAARTSCIDIVNWFYLVTKQKIQSTNTVGCSNRTLRRIFQDLEANSLNATPRQSATPVTPIANDNVDLIRPLELIAAMHDETRDRKSVVSHHAC